jgi:hypothetical protein
MASSKEYKVLEVGQLLWHLSSQSVWVVRGPMNDAGSVLHNSTDAPSAVYCIAPLATAEIFESRADNYSIEYIMNYFELVTEEQAELLQLYKPDFRVSGPKTVLEVIQEIVSSTLSSKYIK